MIYNVDRINANINIPSTNIMRLGPVALIGTAAPLTTVKAGVRSCTFALAA